jgi:hypothetical protein
MNEVKYVGWSFDDINDPVKEKKIMDPITVLVYAALFPCFEEGSKVALSGRTLTMQTPSDYTYSPFGYARIPTRWLFRLGREDNNNLEVFQLCTMKAAEFYDVVNNQEIKKLFEYARDGIVAAKKPYTKKSTPCDAIDKYQVTLDKAIKGEFTFNKTLSEAESRVKGIWSEKEIVWVNQTIIMILENKQKNESVNTDIENMVKKLKEKESKFNEICEQVKERKLNTTKIPKRTPQQQSTRQDQPSQNLIDANEAKDELASDELEFSVVVDGGPQEPPKQSAAAISKEEELTAIVVEGKQPARQMPKPPPGSSRKKK